MTRPFTPACRAPGFRYAHLHATHAHGTHLTDSSAATHYAPLIKLLLLILL